MRKKLAHTIKKASGRFGYRVSQAPKVLAQKPEAELKLHLDFLVAYYLSTLAGVRNEFFFIQIGAFDGVTNDPIYKFVHKYKWQGVLVEPQVDVFQVLVDNYKTQPQLCFENAAIARTTGQLEMYKIANQSGEATNWRNQQATLRRDRLLRFQQRLPDVEKSIIIETVNCITFDDLLDKYHIEALDLLQIDAEGFDYEIIRMVDLHRMKPIIIHYEHRNLDQDEQHACWEYLVQNGYLITKESPVDTIAYCGPMP